MLFDTVLFFNPSYIVFSSAGLSLFTESQTSCESDLLRTWGYTKEVYPLATERKLGFFKTSLFMFSLIVSRSFTEKLAHTSFGVL